MIFFLCSVLFVVKCLASATEFRVKVGEVLEKLSYPNQLQKIKEMASESVLKMAVDFDSAKGHPRMTQINLIPKNSNLQTMTYGMEYKSASSKAVLNIVKDFAKALPGSFVAGEEYAIEAFLVGDKPMTWKLGSIKMPSTVSSVLAEVEDHFYPLPEIKIAPVQQETKQKKTSIVYLIFAGVVLLPWVVLLNSWNLTGFSLKPSAELFSPRVSLFTPLFTLGITCLFALIIASWVSLSIFTQLAALSFLVPPTAYFGFKTFQSAVKN